jgi:4-diphosphocytidyl-2-C-methyl-D-erythritol kinase
MAYPFDFRALLSGDKQDWKGKIKNDFEPSLFAKFPLLEGVKNNFYRQGAWYASMSGSGSSVYGLFERKPHVNPEEFPPGSFIWQEELS